MERKRDGGFPDVRTLKQLVRDRIDPGRDLGHIDRLTGPRATGEPDGVTRSRLPGTRTKRSGLP